MTILEVKITHIQIYPNHNSLGPPLPTAWPARNFQSERDFCIPARARGSESFPEATTEVRKVMATR